LPFPGERAFSRRFEKNHKEAVVNVYENILILDPSLSDEAIEEATQKIKDLITGAGGEVLKVDQWGRKKLAYMLNKQSRGFYSLLLFKAPADTVKKLEDYYNVSDFIVKFMVLKLEKKQKDKALASLSQEAPKAEAAQ
jgi:small subunit ribosomal protein S6